MKRSYDDSLSQQKNKSIKTSAAEVTRSHYNQRPELNKLERMDSRVYHLKCLNNWIKSVLIANYCKPNARVFDLCCGKGGDLLKWSKARIQELVGADIADVSVQQASRRYKEGSFRFPASFYAGDCFSEPISTIVPPQHSPFDFVSCQFALHYCFESETKARQAIKNIADSLRPGAYFVGTIPNANWIVYSLLLHTFIFIERNYDPFKIFLLETLCIQSRLIKKRHIQFLVIVTNFN